jgi:hypothetical protein
MRTVFLILSFILGFSSGVIMHHHLNPLPVYVSQPDGCKYVGMKASGWEISPTYHGGINNDGITAATEYECR